MGKWKKVVLDDNFGVSDDESAVFCFGIEEYVESDEQAEPAEAPESVPPKKKKRKLDTSGQYVSKIAENSATHEVNTLEICDAADKRNDLITDIVIDETVADSLIDEKVSIKRKKKISIKQKVNKSVSHENWLNINSHGSRKAIEGKDLDKVWTQICGVPDPLLKNLLRLNFLQPTEIQRKVLPIAIDGKFDIIGAAETGSGKTLAYVIPALKRIFECRESTENNWKEPKVLILLPTRELAVQVSEHVKALVADITPKIAHVTIVGGLAVHKQERILRKGSPEIIIATPGRLNQLLQSKNIEHLDNLNNIRCLVLDEADRLCEAGHFKDLESILKFVYAKSKANEEDTESESRVEWKRQTLVLSATLTVANQHPSAKNSSTDSTISAIAPVLAKLSFCNTLKIVDITRKDVTAEKLSEQKILCAPNEKDLYLYYCCQTLPEGRKLVFANSIDHIRRLHSLFTLLEFNCRCLHAHMQQRQRLKNLEAFSKSENSVLFCTDVAARGLDIKNVRHVLHYHLPKTYETYVHRSGRTARSGLDGTSIMLVSPPEVKLFVKIVTSLNKHEDSIETITADAKLVRTLSSRITIAQEIEQIEHRNHKVSKEKSWIEGLAKDLDIEYEEDANLGEHKSTKKLRGLKLQLSQMLAKSVSSKKFVNIRNPSAYISVN